MNSATHSSLFSISAENFVYTITASSRVLFAVVSVNSKVRCHALIDTGSNRSFISKAFADRLNVNISRTFVTCASGVSNKMRIEGECNLDVAFEGVVTRFDFIIIENLPHNVVIGLDFLACLDAAIDLQNSALVVSTSRFGSAVDKLFIRATIANCGDIFMLLDTGASCSCIASQYFERFISKLPTPLQAQTSVCDITGSVVEVKGAIELDFAISPTFRCKHPFYIVENLVVDSILGYDWLVTYGKALNTATLVLQNGTRVELNRNNAACSFQAGVEHFQPEQLKEEVFAKVPEAIRDELRQIFSRYAATMSLDGSIGTIDCEPFRILLDTEEPISINKRYRYSYTERRAIDELMDVLTQNKCVEPSCSNFDANVVLATRNGKHRLCVDFGPLNDRTITFPHIMPRFEEMVDAMQGAVIFSKFDLPLGYHQILIHADDIAKTAFTVQGIRYRGKYQWLRLPFGLKNGPMFFQATMEKILRPILGRSTVVNVDDCLVWSKQIENHPKDVEEFLSLIHANNIKLKPEKMDLATIKVEFVGHDISPSGIAISDAKTEKLAQHPAPRNKKELLSFLQFANFLRKHTPYFAQLTAPLYKLTAAKAEFIWSKECQAAFEAVKKAFLEPPVLAFPDPRLAYRCYTDASFEALGAVLCQEQESVERIVACASRVLTIAESHYSATQLECLAVHWALTGPFRQYVWGSPIEVVTDHAALVWLFAHSPTEKSRRLRNWIHELSEYQLKVVHCPGTLQLADSLSRAGSSSTLPIPQAPQLESTERHQLQISAVNIDENTAWSPAFIREQQLADLELGFVLDAIERRIELTEKFESWKSTSLWKARSQVTIADGLFMLSGVSTNRNQASYALILPSSLRHEVLKVCHNAPMSSHLGSARTLASVKQQFWWPGMYQDVSRYCSSCRFCLARKSSNANVPVTAKTTAAPFEDVHIDMVGEILPHSAQGHRYVLSITDAFSKLVTAYPVRDKSANTVARCLIRYCCDFDIPTNLISDRGSEFENDVIAKLCVALGIKKKRTVPYNPRANGQEERSHRTFIDSLAATLSEFGGNWADRLPLAVRAYNTTPNSVTSVTPFEIIRGFPARSPGSLLWHRAAEKNANDVYSHIETAQESLLELWSFVEENIRKAAKRREKETSYAANWQPGDFVYRKIFPSQGGKFRDRFDGPYELVRPIGSVNWLIKRQDEEPFVEAISKLKVISKNPFEISDFSVEEQFENNVEVPIQVESIRYEEVPPLLEWDSDDDTTPGTPSVVYSPHVHSLFDDVSSPSTSTTNSESTPSVADSPHMHILFDDDTTQSTSTDAIESNTTSFTSVRSVLGSSHANSPTVSGQFDASPVASSQVGTPSVVYSPHHDVSFESFAPTTQSNSVYVSPSEHISNRSQSQTPPPGATQPLVTRVVRVNSLESCQEPSRPQRKRRQRSFPGMTSWDKRK